MVDTCRYCKVVAPVSMSQATSNAEHMLEYGDDESSLIREYLPQHISSIPRMCPRA